MPDTNIADRRVRILHDFVGQHAYGKIVSMSEFGNPQALFDIGAIVEVAPDAEDYHTAPTLFEAVHSSSPPTLPNASGTRATQREANIAAGILPPEQGTAAPGGASYVGSPELLHSVSSEQRSEEQRSEPRSKR